MKYDISPEQRAVLTQRIQRYAPKMRSVWRCGCGWEGFFKDYLHHRHGASERPECTKGIKILEEDPERPLDAYVDGKKKEATAPHQEPEPSVADSIPQAPEASTPSGEEEAPSAPAESGLKEYTYNPFGESANEDPEAVARRLLDGLGEKVDTGNGHGGNGHDAELLDGGLALEEPVSPEFASAAVETVLVPAQFRDFYDWSRQNGWKQGNGTFSDWVVAFLFDHLHECLGLELAVVLREVRNNGGS